jgi:hypothetical protein
MTEVTTGTRVLVSETNGTELGRGIYVDEVLLTHRGIDVPTSRILLYAGAFIYGHQCSWAVTTRAEAHEEPVFEFKLPKDLPIFARTEDNKIHRPDWLPAQWIIHFGEPVVVLFKEKPVLALRAIKMSDFDHQYALVAEIGFPDWSDVHRT